MNSKLLKSGISFALVFLLIAGLFPVFDITSSAAVDDSLNTLRDDKISVVAGNGCINITLLDNPSANREYVFLKVDQGFRPQSHYIHYTELPLLTKLDYNVTSTLPADNGTTCYFFVALHNTVINGSAYEFYSWGGFFSNSNG